MIRRYSREAYRLYDHLSLHDVPTSSRRSTGQPLRGISGNSRPNYAEPLETEFDGSEETENIENEENAGPSCRRKKPSPSSGVKRKRDESTERPAKARPTRNLRRTVGDVLNTIEVIRDNTEAQKATCQATIEVATKKVPTSLSENLTYFDGINEISISSLDIDRRISIYRQTLAPEPCIIQIPSPEYESLVNSDVLYINPTITKEANKILYGENIFVSADPATLFPAPPDATGLDHTKSHLIRALRFEKSGNGLTLCNETVNGVFKSLRTIFSHTLPQLHTISIRREVYRPYDQNVAKMQHYVNEHKADIDIQKMYNKKELIIRVAMMMLRESERRTLPFRAISIVEDTASTVLVGNEYYRCRTIQVDLVSDTSNSRLTEKEHTEVAGEVRGILIGAMMDLECCEGTSEEEWAGKRAALQKAKELHEYFWERKSDWLV